MKSVIAALLIALVAAAFAANLFLGDLAEDEDMRAERLFSERVAGYKAGVAAGNPKAQLALGQIYMNAEPELADPKRAVELFRLAANQGDADAHFLLGRAMEEGNDAGLRGGIACLPHRVRLADHPRAMLALGMMHLEGRGVVHSEARAAALFQQAAGFGDSAAQYLMGRVYESGFGVRKDAVEAYKWYLLATRDPDAVKSFNRRFDANKSLLSLAKAMNRNQIETATRLAAEWRKKN